MRHDKPTLSLKEFVAECGFSMKSIQWFTTAYIKTGRVIAEQHKPRARYRISREEADAFHAKSKRCATTIYPKAA